MDMLRYKKSIETIVLENHGSLWKVINEVLGDNGKCLVKISEVNTISRVRLAFREQFLNLFSLRLFIIKN